MAWPRFPACPSYGFSKRADYSVTIVERSSGIRSVNRNWYYPLHTFVAVPLENKPEDDMALVQRFWHSIGGQSGRFLFKDYTDYKSSNVPSDDIQATDQPLVEIADSPGRYQMVKLYEDEEFNYQQQRLIQKPKQGTIRIADDGADLEEGVEYTVDYETGIVTLLNSASGVLTWGGEFDVPVMFESTPEFMIVSHKFQSAGFALRELRLPQPTFVVSS